MKVSPTVAALALIQITLVGSNGARAQWDYGGPPVYDAPAAPIVVAPIPYYYAAPPVVVAPAPYYAAPSVVVAPIAPAPYVAPGYGYSYISGPVPGSVVVNGRTGRWCTFAPSGYRWCWTP